MPSGAISERFPPLHAPPAVRFSPGDAEHSKVAARMTPTSGRPSVPTEARFTDPGAESDLSICTLRESAGASVALSRYARSGGSIRRRSIVLAVLLAAGVFTSLWRLEAASWNFDELAYRKAGLQYAHGDYKYNLEHPFLGKQLIGISMALLGDTRLGARLPAALLTLGTGLILLSLGTWLDGFGTGLTTAATWWLLPRAPGVLEANIGRYALLEPVTLFFEAAALALAWSWVRTGRAWVAAAAGAAVGLAASSKLTGLLVLPAVLLAVGSTPRSWRVRLAQASVLALAMAVGFLGPYLAAGPAGLSAIGHAFKYQAIHATRGHLQFIAGHASLRPPWWSGFWWQTQYLGVAGTVALWAASLTGLMSTWRTRPRVAVFVTASFAVPVAAVCMAPLQLPHYHLAFSVGQALAAGLGLAAAWRQITRRPSSWRSGAALAVIVTLALVALGSMRAIATLRPGDYRAAAQFLRVHGLDRSAVLVLGYPEVMSAELPGAPIVNAPRSMRAFDRSWRQYDVLVIDSFIAKRYTRSAADGDVHRLASTYEEYRFDRLTVYVRTTATSPQVSATCTVGATAPSRQAQCARK